jgi:hypothetical protein
LSALTNQTPYVPPAVRTSSAKVTTRSASASRWRGWSRTR